MCRHLSCLAAFPTEAVNLDGGEGVAGRQKQHLKPLLQTISELVPVTTLSDNPCSAVTTLKKFLLKTLLVIDISSEHEDNSSTKVFCLVVFFLGCGE